MDTPSAPAPDDKGKEFAAIQEGINKLSETVTGIMGRLDDVDSRIETFTPPPSPPTEQPKWQPKSWDEFPEMAEQVAQKIVAETEAKKQATAEEAKNQEQATLTQIDRDFDAQLQRLESEGLIPPVKNAQDPNDPGGLVRKELFALGVKYNSPDLISMANLRNEFVSNGFSFDYKTGKILRNPSPLGAAAPVASPSGSGAGGKSPSYQEIHRLSMDEMARRFNQ